MTIPPCAFDICLSNRCNMKCRYCYFRAVNKGKPGFLTFDQVARGVDIYLSHARPSQIDKISLAGGEPFLNYPLLLKIVDYIRAKAGIKPDIEIFTNGTLLTSERAGELLKRRIKFVLSIDGNREINDRNRIFHRNPKKSVFDVLMKNIKTLPGKFLPEICVGVTFTSETAHSLAESVRFLRSLGFGEVQLNVNLLEIWTEAGLERLRTGARELGSYFRSLARTEMKSFADFRFGLDYFLLKEETESLDNLSTFREISLSPEGRFYPSGLASTCGSGRGRYCIGTLESGLDFEKMAVLRKEAVEYLKKLDRKYCVTYYISNPILLYFAIRLRKINPLSLFRSTRKVFDIVYKELGPYLSLEKAFNTLSSDSLFGDFSHPPRHIADKEVRRLMLELGGADAACNAPSAPREEESLPCSCSKGTRSLPGLAPAREEVDFFLYSPGKNKEILFCCDDIVSKLGLLEAICVYSVMKAEHLGKKLSVSVAGDKKGGEPKECFVFLKEHGIALTIRAGDPDAAKSTEALLRRESPRASGTGGSRSKAERGVTGMRRDFSRAFQILGRAGVNALIELRPENIDNLPKIFEDAASAGFENFILQVNLHSVWNSRDVKSLNRGLKHLEAYICDKVKYGRRIFLRNICNLSLQDPEERVTGSFYALLQLLPAGGYAVLTGSVPACRQVEIACRNILGRILNLSGRNNECRKYMKEAVCREKRRSSLLVSG